MARIKALNWDDFFRKNRMVVYRITPHISVTNNTNRKLWRTIHKLYEVYDSPRPRLDVKFRGGLRISYREKDTVHFDVVFRNVDGEKKVEFYVSTTEFWAKKLREVIEDRMKVTIEEAELSDLQVPRDNTVVQEIRYLRHDIFSMNTNATEQTSPIASIMSALDDITDDGDYARLSVAAETLSRAKWSKLNAYAHEQLAKGKEPRRVRFSPQNTARTIGQGVAWAVNETNAIIHDTLEGISRAFFKSDKTDTPADKLIDTRPDDVYNSRKSLDKRYQPVYKARVRVAAHSDNKLRRDLIANTISGAYAEIGEDNEMVGFTVRLKTRRNEIIDEMNTLKLSGRTKADSDVNLVSCDEMAKVALQLPTRDVQMRYEDELAVNRKVETEIPSVFQDDSGMIIGHSELKGEEMPIYLPMDNYDELFRSYVFQGSQGMGKDTAIKNFIVEACLNHGIGAIIPDAIMENGERGMADGIRDSLPPDKVIDIDLSDTEYPVPMDLTEIVRKLGKNGANRFAQEIIDFFGDVESMGQSRSILREFAKASNGSIHDIKMLIENEDYRVDRIKELRGNSMHRIADSLDKWTSEWGEDKSGNPKLIKDGQKALDGKSSAVLYRLDELLGDDALFNIFAQPPKDDVDFEKWVSEGKVVILRIPNRKLGTLAVKTLIHWITLKTFMTKLLMDDGNKGVFIVFNEPHQYMTPGLERILQRIVLEGRKWRIGSLYAFHHIGLLPKTFADDLQASGTNWFLFSNTHKNVYERLSEELSPNFTIESAMATEKYHAICLLSFGGRRQAPFLIRALPPTTDRLETFDNSFITKRHSRIYGRHWTGVERMISEKEKIS